MARLVSRGRPCLEETVRVGRSRQIRLRTYPRGPLCLRRAAWLGHVASGTLRLGGVLPRTESAWAELPAEARAALEGSVPGVFALSDLYACHSPSAPEEWVHALYQASSPGGAGSRLVASSLFRLALLSPVDP
jgi:hypothetical protein